MQGLAALLSMEVMCRPTALSAEQVALQESRKSALRELATWQEQETVLARHLLQEEQQLQALQAQHSRLSDMTGELERQQVAPL